MALVVAGAVLPVGINQAEESKPVSAANKPDVAVERKAAEAVKGAVANLQKEVQAAMKDHDTGKLRQKSDYFTENKTPDLTPTAIANALVRSQGSDAFADAYIKWQLLSGLGKTQLDPKDDAAVIATLLTAYRSAPAPAPRPGLEPADKKAMDVWIRQPAGQKEIPEINKRLEAQVGPWEKFNHPSIEYRDELFARLLQAPESLNLGLADAYLRASRGVDCDRFMDKVLGQLTVWGASANTAQIRAVDGVLRDLIVQIGGTPPAAPAPPAKAAARPAGEAYGSDVRLIAGGPPAPAKKDPAFPPKFYAAAKFDEKARHLFWEEGRAKFVETKVLSGAISKLDEMAQTDSGGGLQFKDKTK